MDLLVAVHICIVIGGFGIMPYCKKLNANNFRNCSRTVGRMSLGRMGSWCLSQDGETRGETLSRQSDMT